MAPGGASASSHWYIAFSFKISNGLMPWRCPMKSNDLSYDDWNNKSLVRISFWYWTLGNAIQSYIWLNGFFIVCWICKSTEMHNTGIIVFRIESCHSIGGMFFKILFSIECDIIPINCDVIITIGCSMHMEESKSCPTNNEKSIESNRFSYKYQFTV